MPSNNIAAAHSYPINRCFFLLLSYDEKPIACTNILPGFMFSHDVWLWTGDNVMFAISAKQSGHISCFKVEKKKEKKRIGKISCTHI